MRVEDLFALGIDDEAREVRGQGLAACRLPLRGGFYLLTALRSGRKCSYRRPADTLGFKTRSTRTHVMKRKLMVAGVDGADNELLIGRSRKQAG